MASLTSTSTSYSAVTPDILPALIFILTFHTHIHTHVVSCNGPHQLCITALTHDMLLALLLVLVFIHICLHAGKMLQTSKRFCVSARLASSVLGGELADKMSTIVELLLGKD